jgi:hypothetical protein
MQASEYSKVKNMAKIVSSLLNLFVYSMVKPVSDGCFPYLKFFYEK